MDISHVEINNFRALHEIAIPLNRLSVLLGENDVGKTSFLYALDRFFANKKLDDAKEWFKEKTADSIRIALTFRHVPEDEALEKITRQDNTVVLERVFAFDKAPVTRALLDDGSLVEVPKPAMQHWFSLDNFHLVPVRRDIAVQFSMTKTALLGKTLRALMKKTMEQGGGADALSAIQATLSGAIEPSRTALESYLKQQMHNEHLSVEFNDFSVDPIEGVTFEVCLSDDRVENVAIRNRGAGTQNNLIIALFRFIAEENLGKYLIFAMEEPENSLHPKAQRQLLSVIQDLSEQSQVIVTTHSPVFIDRTNFQNNILLTRLADGKTVAKSFDNTLLEQLRTDLGIRASDALLKGGGNCALLVEGATEEDGFPMLMEMCGMSEFALGMSIIKIGGSDFQKIRNIALLLNAYDIPCVIVLDRDATKAAEDLERVREASLSNIQRIAVLSKGMIEDYYPLEIVAEVINQHLSPSTPIHLSEFDAAKSGAARLDEVRRLMHEHGAGSSIEYFKQLLGSHGTAMMKKKGLPVDPELVSIFVDVKKIAERI